MKRNEDGDSQGPQEPLHVLAGVNRSRRGDCDHAAGKGNRTADSGVAAEVIYGGLVSKSGREP